MSSRIHTEEDVRRVLSLLESALESTADGILIVARDGTVSRFNRRFAEMWRIPEEILASGDDDRLLYWAVRQTKEPASFLARVRALYAAPEDEAFDSFEMKDGRVFERCSKPHRLGGEIVGRVWSFRDVTARKRAEEEVRTLNAELERRVDERTAELAASEERFRALAETAVDAIVSVDAQARITFWNLAAQRLFGYSVDEAIGRPLAILIPPGAEQAYRQCLERFSAKNGPEKGKGPEEMSLRHKDGDEFPVELSLAAWTSGGRRFFTAIIRDVTARKRAERALESFAAQLQASNKELESFSSSVAHDLRAPLRTIDGFSKILIDSFASQINPQGRHFLERIRVGAQQMSAIIDDLLMLSRVTRVEMRKEPVDLSRLARGIAAELRLKTPDRKAAFDIEEGARAWGDAALLRVVIENLLDNAWKFSGKAADPRIEFRTTRREGALVFLVRDNGIGFDPAFAGRLFKPFVRLNPGHEYSGTGIGLTIVQRIIERHGGGVWAEGAPGRGAAIYFTLPERGAEEVS